MGRKIPRNRAARRSGRFRDICKCGHAVWNPGYSSIFCFCLETLTGEVDSNEHVKRCDCKVHHPMNNLEWLDFICRNGK